ncbi:hypothetical protein V5O48_015606 [Marasmius crinis-equi]|uniref:Uncharacterized protein n=1 Tax=Marasmius crinis-equi TaxID=585013 RepID=A0ABR3EU15_9AGAR
MKHDQTSANMMLTAPSPVSSPPVAPSPLPYSSNSTTLFQTEASRNQSQPPSWQPVLLICVRSSDLESLQVLSALTGSACNAELSDVFSAAAKLSLGLFGTAKSAKIPGFFLSNGTTPNSWHRLQLPHQTSQNMRTALLDP